MKKLLVSIFIFLNLNGCTSLNSKHSVIGIGKANRYEVVKVLVEDIHQRHNEIEVRARHFQRLIEINQERHNGLDIINSLQEYNSFISDWLTNTHLILLNN